MLPPVTGQGCLELPIALATNRMLLANLTSQHSRLQLFRRALYLLHSRTAAASLYRIEQSPLLLQRFQLVDGFVQGNQLSLGLGFLIIPVPNVDRL